MCNEGRFANRPYNRLGTRFFHEIKAVKGLCGVPSLYLSPRGGEYSLPSPFGRGIKGEGQRHVAQGIPKTYADIAEKARSY
jgi:hypothetical protein